MVIRIARKEFTEMIRDGRFRLAGAIVFALLVVALLTGWKRHVDVSRQHAVALQTQRDLWLSQGAKNPHSAAHYGYYVFKPKLALSALDQGLDPYLGVSLFLEAHKQNTANYRPVEDATPVQRFGELTAAATLQGLIPLLIVLLAYAAFAGEREQRTLRQLLSLGVERKDLALGKALGVAAPLLAVQSLSMGLSGTDFAQHRHFNEAAERYRRMLVNTLNQEIVSQGATDLIWDFKDRDARNVYAVARLKPGVSYEQARAELNAFSRRMAETYPNINAGLGFTLKPLRDLYAGDVRPYLWLLLAAVGFVLLIACANVINLLLARSLSREREIAIRTALGAGRSRLISQLLTESLLLAVVGGLVGLVTGWGWIKLLRSLVRAEMPAWITIDIDWRVLAFTLAVSILTGLMAGLAPALQASKPNLNELLKEGAKGSQGAARHHLRKSLVTAEIALALVSLVGAGLMVRSFLRLQQTDLGFKPDNLLTMRVALPWRKYNDTQGPERQKQFYQQLLDRLAALPGVESAAMTSNLPLSSERQEGKLTFTVEGQSAEEQQRNPYLNALRASPNYFQTIGVRLLKGRLLNEFDREETERVGVISRRLAERAWPGQDPIGKRLKVGGVNSQGRWTSDCAASSRGCGDRGLLHSGAPGDEG